MDALRVIVNRHNPLTQLSQRQLDAIFSSTRKCGAPYSIDTWEEFGWVPSADDLSPIKPYILFEKSGIHEVFRQKVLCNGQYHSKVNKRSKNRVDIIKAVSQSLTAIGFVGWEVIDYNVKSLALSKYRFHPHYFPTDENIVNRKYPLSRYLYLYIDNPPQTEIPLVLQEWFKFVFSLQGQQIVAKHRAIPLPIKHITQEIRRLSH
jgi:phosphate transport system substrate-binding protein